MKQYKTIAGPVGLTIGKGEDENDAVKQYASILNKEADGGWEFLCIQAVPVIKNKGCLAGLFAAIGIGTAVEQFNYNMLVFVKNS